MANEFRKVTDQNGVDHPVCDDTRVDWSSYARTGVHQLIPLTLDNLKAWNTNGTWNNNAYTVDGTTYTVNVDSKGDVLSIITSGTASGTNSLVMYVNLPSGTYEANGNPDNGALETYSIQVKKDSPSGQLLQQITDANDRKLTFSEMTKVCLYIRIQSGYGTSKTFYPMVRLDSDTNRTYAPYAMTNRELTEKAATKTVNDSLAYSGITSSNYLKLVHNGYVGMVQLDFTVGNTDIAAWTAIVQFAAKMYTNGSEDILVAFRDTSSSDLIYRRISVSSDGKISFSDGFTANHRYQTTFMVMIV